MCLRCYHFIITLMMGVVAISCETFDTAIEEMASVQLPEIFTDSTAQVEFDIDKVQLNLTEFRFEGETPEDRDVEFKIEHDHGVAVDLLGTSVDSSLVPHLPSGPYVEIEVRLKAESVKGQPTLVVEGALKDSLEQGIPLVLQIHHEFELRLEIENESEPFHFDRNFLTLFRVREKISQTLLNVDRSLWSGAEMDDQGIIVISKDHNSIIFKEISLTLGDDFKIEIEHE